MLLILHGPYLGSSRLIFYLHSISLQDELQCDFQTSIEKLRGWRGQVPRQPGQIRKEAATTSPTWVDVQPLTSVTAS